MPIGNVGVGRLVASLVLDTSQFSRGIMKAESAMARAGASMQRVGRLMTTFITLPLVAAGAAGIKMAMDFNDAFGKMEGLAEVPRAELDGLKKTTLQLSKATGRMPQELANALYFIESSGHHGAEALQTLTVSAQAARAGMGDAATVADLTTAVLSAYGKENITAANAVDTLTAAITLGKAEPNLMARNLGMVIPIAAEMGVGFNQVAAAVAAMSRKMSASNVSTAVIQLRQVLSDLLSPSEKSRKALEHWGTSASELRQVIKERGLLEALDFVARKMKDDDEAFSKIFGNVRSLTGALQLAGVSSQDVSEIFHEMSDNTGRLDRAVAAMANTVGDRWRRALASLAGAGIQLGNALLPLFEQLIQTITKAANWFSTLDQSSKNLFVSLMAIFALSGPVMVGLGIMVSTIAALASTVGLVIAAVALLALSFGYLYDNWEAVKERIQDWGWWQNMIIDMIQFIIKMNPFEMLFKPLFDLINIALKLNPLLKGIQIPDFTKLAIEGLEKLKTDTKEYQHQFGTMQDAILHGWQKIKASISGLFTHTGGGTGVPTVPEVPLTPTPGTPTTNPFEPATKTWFGEGDQIFRKVNMAVVDLDRSMQHIIGETFVKFGEAIGSLVTGGSTMADFLTSLLQTVLDFGKDFGKELILAGVAALAFHDLLLSPGAAIAAGVALVAASSAASAILQKGPGGGSGGSGVSGGHLPSEMHAAGIRPVRLYGEISGYNIGLNQEKDRYRRGRMG